MAGLKVAVTILDISLIIVTTIGIDIKSKSTAIVYVVFMIAFVMSVILMWH